MQLLNIAATFWVTRCRMGLLWRSFKKLSDKQKIGQNESFKRREKGRHVSVIAVRSAREEGQEKKNKRDFQEMHYLTIIRRSGGE